MQTLENLYWDLNRQLVIKKGRLRWFEYVEHEDDAD